MSEWEKAGGAKVAGASGKVVPWVVLAAVAIAITVTGSYLLVNRLTELQREKVRLIQRIDRLSEKVDQTASRSEEAILRASQAENNALRAAQGRLEAERASTAAQQRAQLARKQAETARLKVEEARQEAERIRREREEELNRLQSALNQIVETRRTALGLIMNLGNDFIQFDFDKSTLRSQNKEVLAKIVGVLLTSTGYRVQVYGHTDDVGTEAYNLELSRRRAAAVRDYFIEAGIDPDIITMKGVGKSNPLVAGTTATDRQKNRRVEIGIIDSFIDYEGAFTEKQ